MIRHAAPARVGILGYPSDRFGGRSLALAVPQFEATVVLEPADGVEIVGGLDDQHRWLSPGAMADHLDRHGFCTGAQLLAAAVRTFLAVAEPVGCRTGAGFRLSYSTTIPRQVGLGGSSALVVAALRCLDELHQLGLPLPVLASVALRAETAQLGLAANLGDGVVQTYGGLMSMDFTEPVVDARFGVSHGRYDQLDASALPPLFVAFREAGTRPIDAEGRHLALRPDSDPMARDVTRELATLVTEARAALRWSDRGRLGGLLERNTLLWRTLAPVPEDQQELIDAAVAAGAQATVAGPGGAVVGTFRDDRHFESLCDAYADIGADIVRIDHGPASDVPGTTARAAGNVLSLDRHGHRAG